MRRSFCICLAVCLAAATLPLAASFAGATIIPEPLEFYGDAEYSSLWAQLGHRIQVQPFNLVALIIFACAILHTFFASRFTAAAHALQRRLRTQRRKDPLAPDRQVSFGVEILHFLGEVEIVFGLWCIPLILAITFWFDWPTAEEYLNSRNYTEPLFVIVIMTLTATRPILRLTERIIAWIAGLFGGGTRAWWIVLVTAGPLLGSFVTEPGAMTITALLLAKQIYSRKPSMVLAYATLGLLFVNISVGGVLTNFAAPPVLIVAHRWGWSAGFMFLHFGWKAIVGIVVANCLYLGFFWKELGAIGQRVPTVKAPDIMEGVEKNDMPVPAWITIVHVLLIVCVVYVAHDPIVFLGIFLLFLGFHQATAPHQLPLRVRFPLLVGLFLCGLVIHGGLQGWWITPILDRLARLPLMVIATILTAFNDNASITYLSSLSGDFTDALKYAVTAGAVTGGGLTVIANAPNPAGQQILGKYFPEGVNPLALLLGAIVPTIVMGLAFIFLGTDFLLSKT